MIPVSNSLSRWAIKTLIAICCILLCSQLYSQEKLTTVILLRHAEKESDGGKNPDLSEAGKKRALHLVDIFSKTKIDAIYSTDFKRTENTVLPLAQAQNLSVLKYDGGKLNDLNDTISKYKGGTIVICGHSNTTPVLINQILGKQLYKTFDDSDYGNLVIVTISETKAVKVTWLRY